MLRKERACPEASSTDLEVAALSWAPVFMDRKAGPGPLPKRKAEPHLPGLISDPTGLAEGSGQTSERIQMPCTAGSVPGKDGL